MRPGRRDLQPSLCVFMAFHAFKIQFVGFPGFLYRIHSPIFSGGFCCLEKALVRYFTKAHDFASLPLKQGDCCPGWHVTETHYWLISNDRFFRMSNIRPTGKDCVLSANRDKTNIFVGFDERKQAGPGMGPAGEAHGAGLICDAGAVCLVMQKKQKSLDFFFTKRDKSMLRRSMCFSPWALC